jgi:uncharacterized membrane protein
LWANLRLLFWLSLAPFVTGWMEEKNFAPTPTAIYGVVLLMAAIAYWILQRTIIAEQGHTSVYFTHDHVSDTSGMMSAMMTLAALQTTADEVSHAAL